MAGRVTIIDNGRDGRVRYTEGVLQIIEGYWEFGGGDVITVVSMGSRADWQRSASWAVDRRAAILRSIADEVVRQRAPTCVAEVDEATGVVLLRQREGIVATPPQSSLGHQPSVQFVRRYTKLKAMLGSALAIFVLVVVGAIWISRKGLSVAPATGVPLGICVRTDTHIASLLQANDPHLPEISGRGGNTTTSISIVLFPLDGSAMKKIVIAESLADEQIALARILGSDGRVLWFDVNGPGGVDLQQMKLVDPREVREPEPPRSATPFPPDPDNNLSSGFIAAPGQWFGLHSEEERTVEFAPRKFVRPVASQQNRKQMRRFMRGVLDVPVEGMYHQIVSMEPIGDGTYLNAAFLRMDSNTEPYRCADPDGALMVHTDKPGLGGKLIVSRVDLNGTVLWSTDTGIDRFSLTQILPGERSFAFVGTRPPVEGKLSEPLVVIVDNNTGRMIAHSLWQ
jgi:hypothetical protein